MFDFHKLIKPDRYLLQKWLNANFAMRWYEKRKFVYDDIELIFSQGSRAKVPVNAYIVRIENKAIGYIHKFKVSDYPIYANCVQMRDAVCIDMFLGEKEYFHKGYGKEIIKRFIEKYVFNDGYSSLCMTGLNPSDTSAIRMYEKAGFTYLKTIKCKYQKDEEYIMILKKTNYTLIYEAS